YHNTYRLTLQYALWDFLRELGESDVGGLGRLSDESGSAVVPLRRIVNVAKLYAWLLSRQALSLLILKTVTFARVGDQARVFFQVMFTTLFTLHRKRSAQDEQTLFNVFHRAAANPTMCHGILFFFHHFVRNCELVAEDDRSVVKWGCRVAKQAITAVRAASDTIVFSGASAAEVEAQLLGRQVTDSGRRGKQFWLSLSDDLSLLLHFGMTGEMHIQGEQQNHYRKISVDVGDAWPPQYTKLELDLGSTRVAFTDPRRLGRIRVYEGDAAASPVVSKLGFDPVIDPPDPETFARLVTCRRMPIKALLLKQDFSAGVGNWIADEVLFQSRIHPAQMANSLNQAQTRVLLDQLELVCRTAVDVNAESTLFPKDWLFHYRWTKGRGRAPQLPDGRQIEFVTVGGRTSAFVPAVQVLNSPEPVEASGEDEEAEPARRSKRRKK
ncbi:hypothetical protein H4R23_003429, partial [Coemansia sp. Cherry 401B]